MTANYINSGWNIDSKIFVVKTIGDGSCFFHAVLTLIYPKYLDLSEKERKDFVKILRETLADGLSRREWKHLANGQLALYLFSKELQKEGLNQHNVVKQTVDELITALSEETKEDLEDILENVYQRFIEMMKGCDVWVGVDEASVNLFEYLSNLFNINIYILRDTTRKPYLFGSCETLYKADRDSIIVLWVGSSHYEAVVEQSSDKEITRIFTSDSEVSKRLFKYVCERTK